MLGDRGFWCTPEKYVEAVREVLGFIDLDPYSDEIANTIVKANRIFTLENPAEINEWNARTVFMNAPYTRGVPERAIAKLILEHKKYGFSAIVLTNNATETRWFVTLSEYASRICLPYERIQFMSPDKKGESTNTRGQVFHYIGSDSFKFEYVFNKIGSIWRRQF